ncbi:MAG: glycosyltransferase [Deltaproteobacteria bacterium]|nr:glycosyltransferase [Deltaproteobacteria bacterium]
MFSLSPIAMKLIVAAYFLTLAGLAVFGTHRYLLLYLYRKNRRRRNAPPAGRFAVWPRVTVQLPLYDEMYVAKRLIDAACGLDYPKDRLEVQVLDDSDDETRGVVDDAVDRWRGKGFNVRAVRRLSREGFKAGALAYGLERASGEFVAVFDADFVPPPDFLKKTVPYFTDASIGMVQTRWTHLNENYSLATRLQALYLDGHFVIEHAARCWSGRFFNFNGTAGVWRRQAIDDAGGWQHDTITEDLDLSYRAQLAGWKFHYLLDVETPAEVPALLSGFRTQQFRWTKGSIETALKLLPRIWRAALPLRVKLEATVHLTGNLAYLLVAAPLSTLRPVGHDPRAYGVAVHRLARSGDLRRRVGFDFRLLPGEPATGRKADRQDPSAHPGAHGPRHRHGREQYARGDRSPVGPPQRVRAYAQAPPRRTARPRGRHALPHAPRPRTRRRIRRRPLFPAADSVCHALRGLGVAALSDPLLRGLRVSRHRDGLADGAFPYRAVAARRARLMRVAVVIPALDEAESIGLVLDDIPKDRVERVVVADNGSRDATADIARAHGAEVVLETHRGYGAACLAGLAHLKADPPDAVLFLDADRSDYPEEASLLLDKIAEGYDLVIGSRARRAEPGALLPQARFGNRLATFLIRLFWGTRFTDLGPFRAVTWNTLERIAMADRDFGWTVEMQLKAARLKLRCAEVDVRYRKRHGDKSKVTGTLAGTVKAGVKILYVIFRHALAA